MASARVITDGARNAPIRASASSRQAATRARCSPIRAASAPAGQVSEQLPDADQGHDERGDADAGPQIAGRQGHQRENRPLADRDQSGRTVRGDRDAAQARQAPGSVSAARMASRRRS